MFSLSGSSRNGVVNLVHRGRRSGEGVNRNKKRFEYQRVAMLQMRDLATFKYFIREILEDSSMDQEAVNAFIANLITKGSRNSLMEAKEYVKELAEKGVFADETSDKICTLLDRNRKYR
jgi:hypothetical protein